MTKFKKHLNEKEIPNGTNQKKEQIETQAKLAEFDQVKKDYAQEQAKLASLEKENTDLRMKLADSSSSVGPALGQSALLANPVTSYKAERKVVNPAEWSIEEIDECLESLALVVEEKRNDKKPSGWINPNNITGEYGMMVCQDITKRQSINYSSKQIQSLGLTTHLLREVQEIIEDADLDEYQEIWQYRFLVDDALDALHADSDQDSEPTWVAQRKSEHFSYVEASNNHIATVHDACALVGNSSIHALDAHTRVMHAPDSDRIALTQESIEDIVQKQQVAEKSCRTEVSTIMQYALDRYGLTIDSECTGLIWPEELVNTINKSNKAGGGTGIRVTTIRGKAGEASVLAAGGAIPCRRILVRNFIVQDLVPALTSVSFQCILIPERWLIAFSTEYYWRAMRVGQEKELFVFINDHRLALWRSRSGLIQIHPGEHIVPAKNVDNNKLPWELQGYGCIQAQAMQAVVRPVVETAIDYQRWRDPLAISEDRLCHTKVHRVQKILSTFFSSDVSRIVEIPGADEDFEIDGIQTCFIIRAHEGPGCIWVYISAHKQIIVEDDFIKYSSTEVSLYHLMYWIRTIADYPEYNTKIVIPSTCVELVAPLYRGRVKIWQKDDVGAEAWDTGRVCSWGQMQCLSHACFKLRVFTDPDRYVQLSFPDGIREVGIPYEWDRGIKAGMLTCDFAEEIPRKLPPGFDFLNYHSWFEAGLGNRVAPSALTGRPTNVYFICDSNYVFQDTEPNMLFWDPRQDEVKPQADLAKLWRDDYALENPEAHIENDETRRHNENEYQLFQSMKGQRYYDFESDEWSWAQDCQDNHPFEDCLEQPAPGEEYKFWDWESSYQGLIDANHDNRDEHDDGLSATSEESSPPPKIFYVFDASPEEVLFAQQFSESDHPLPSESASVSDGENLSFSSESLRPPEYAKRSYRQSRRAINWCLRCAVLVGIIAYSLFDFTSPGGTAIRFVTASPHDQAKVVVGNSIEWCDRLIDEDLLKQDNDPVMFDPSTNHQREAKVVVGNSVAW